LGRGPELRPVVLLVAAPPSFPRPSARGPPLNTTSWPSALPGSHPSGSSPGNRYGTARTCAGTRAGGRSGCSGCGDAPGTSASSSGARPVPCVPSSCSSGGTAHEHGRLAAERHAQLAQQRVALVVLVRRRDEHDVHPVDLLDLVVVDLRE